jgi:hypothetical protein
MAGERAALMATDPPYLVGYEGGQHPASEANGGAGAKDKRRLAQAFPARERCGRSVPSGVYERFNGQRGALPGTLSDKDLGSAKTPPTHGRGDGTGRDDERAHS